MSRGEEKAKRWSFSLKSMFLWSLVVGLAIGWLLNVAANSKQMRSLKDQLTAESALRQDAQEGLEVLSGVLNHIYDQSDGETKRKLKVHLEELRSTQRDIKVLRLEEQRRRAEIR